MTDTKKSNTFKNSQKTTSAGEPNTVSDANGNSGKDNKKARKSAKSAKSERKGMDPRLRNAIGILLLCLAIFLGIALVKYLISFYGAGHQEYGSQTLTQGAQLDKTTGNLGAYISQVLIKESFGIGAFFIVYLLTLIGLKLCFLSKIRMWGIWKIAVMGLVWLPLFFAYLPSTGTDILGGAVGKWLYTNLYRYIGNAGIIIALASTFLIFLIFEFNFTIAAFEKMRQKRAEKLARQQVVAGDDSPEITDAGDADPIEDDKVSAQRMPNEHIQETQHDSNTVEMQTHKSENVFMPKENPPIVVTPHVELPDEPEDEPIPSPTSASSNSEIKLVIEETPKEEILQDGKVHHGLDTKFDPHYELSDYMLPSLDLLPDLGNSKANVSSEELEANKDKIVETLGNYGIQIDRIKATIGPTVTLYEIVPAPGVRISKIKNLEDDIALSLSALGIRIIAPIPGKGTIGIEVPNSKPQTVSMRSCLASDKFQNSKYDLPFAIGKTIQNETYVADLAKMPHLLVAGATGQGKSVGLNAIITSLLYCKHPSELKFVMVDPKKVELSLYRKIERHYLAKMPGEEDAIVTDTKKVILTLNSLCREMDERYELLKAAQCRNIKEYNEKFTERRLLPTEGHRFMPYIVLVVDEFADLIMTAGRDIETPIARLAQLARAIGIHLIIATQRPSVNIITGAIKANFPARIAFRVISSVDSKTILDHPGANQLIGRGDMLLSTGNEIVRLQCAFVDTPELEAITDFIGSQRGFPEAFMLPQVDDDTITEDSEDSGNGERDSLFEDAARIVVQTQQGSTSMIQRKLKLGYNRAGRIIDQLEAAGIVGPYAGSKTREVKVSNEFALEQILKDIENRDNGI